MPKMIKKTRGYRTNKSRAEKNGWKAPENQKTETRKEQKQAATISAEMLPVIDVQKPCNRFLHCWQA